MNRKHRERGKSLNTDGVRPNLHNKLQCPCCLLTGTLTRQIRETGLTTKDCVFLSRSYLFQDDVVIFLQVSCHRSSPNQCLLLSQSLMEAYCFLILVKGKVISKERHENAIHCLFADMDFL